MLAESHSLPTFKQRKEMAYKAERVVNPLAKERWMRADDLVDSVYCDLVNGKTCSDILLKLKNCQYDGQKKAIKDRMARDYYIAAKSRMKYDFEADMKDLRADVYAKLLAIYADAVENDDRSNALGALDKMLKLGGIDKPQTNIQVNSGEGGGITVNFGFNQEENLQN